METKSMKKGSRRGPDGLPDGELEQHRRRRPKKEGAGPLRVACGTPFWEPSGSEVGAKSRQNGDQKYIKI